MTATADGRQAVAVPIILPRRGINIGGIRRGQHDDCDGGSQRGRGWSTVVEGRGGRTLGRAGGGGWEVGRISPAATGGSFCVRSMRTLACAVAALLIGVM
jgi:hypothetical protein